MFGGGIENFEECREYLEPYTVEEVDKIQPQYRAGEDVYTPFSVLPTVFVYNNKLVYPVAAPKTWAEANGTTPDQVEGYLALQTLNKVFEYNCTGDKVYDNCWDFVAEDTHALFMDIDSEVVGKNFLYMLTEDKYAAMLKDAFNALPTEEQAYFQPTVDEMESEANDLGLGADGKYALAWIKLWVGSYNAQTDDGPICNTLVSDSATDQCGLLVYSKLRSVE